MTKINSTLLCACLPLLSLLVLGCGGDDEEDAGGEMLASSQNASLIIYGDPYAPMMAGMPNPIDSPMARATALAFDDGGELRIELAVENFPASRTFGSHLHKLDCMSEKAGGHYQNMPFPEGGMANDPMFANADNEAWLDFTTDASGTGAVEQKVNWLPRAGEAKAIIFHHMATAAGGGAGARLACLPLTGF